MSKQFILRFNTDLSEVESLTVAHADLLLPDSSVKTAMQKIVAANIFKTAKGEFVSLNSAEAINIIEKEIAIT